MELERIEDENATTQFIATVISGKENDVVLQILEYFKVLGIELSKKQMPKISGGVIKLKTTQEHAKHLATWLEDPRIQGRGQDEMYIIENENPWMGGSHIGSHIHYSEPAVDKNGKTIPSTLIHPEETAELSSKLVKHFRAENKKNKMENQDNAAEFEMFIKKQLDLLKDSSDEESKKATSDMQYKASLIQAVIRNLRVKKDNELEKPFAIEPYKRKSLLGSMKIKKDDKINLQGEQAEKQ